MKLYLLIITHEWRNLVRDKTLATIVLIFAATAAYGIYNGVRWAEKQTETARRLDAARDELVSRSREELLKYEAELAVNPKARKPQGTIPQVLGITGYQAALPLQPLAALSVGQGDLFPTAAKVTMYKSKADLFAEVENENPLNLLAGNFDYAFVIVYLYPLIILALCYNIVSAERENGTLQMMMAQPVTLWQFALGKILVRAAAAFGLAILFSLVGAWFAGANLAAGNGFYKISLWIVVIVCYGAFWFALAALVNAFGKSSVTNAASLAAWWLLFVLIVPSALNLLINLWHPIPSRVELVQATRRAANEAEEKGAQLLAGYFQDHPELLPGNREINFKNQAQIYLAVQANVGQKIEPLIQEFDEQTIKQQRLVGFYRFLSPAIVAQVALNDLAGTSAARYEHFRRQVENFLSDWKSFFIPKVFSTRLMTAQDYEIYPRFDLTDEPDGAVAGRVFIGLLGLILPTFLIGLFGWRVLRRSSAAN